MFKNAAVRLSNLFALIRMYE